MIFGGTLALAGIHAQTRANQPHGHNPECVICIQSEEARFNIWLLREQGVQRGELRVLQNASMPVAQAWAVLDRFDEAGLQMFQPSC
jgi:hypothetical protein